MYCLLLIFAKNHFENKPILTDGSSEVMAIINSICSRISGKV